MALQPNQEFFATVAHDPYIKFFVKYEILGQDIAKNQTTVRATSYVRTTNWDFYSNDVNKTITVDGQKSEQLHVKLDQGRNTTTALISLTKVITHNADGTRSFRIQAHLNCYAGSYGPGSNCNLDTGDITLPTIPRASTISASINHEAGDSIPVTINRASSSFTHDLVFKVGNTTIKTLTGIATSATFTFTNSEVGAIVRAISGTSSSAQIVCTTKNGSKPFRKHDYRK